MNLYTVRLLTPSSTAAATTQPPEFSNALSTSRRAWSWSLRQDQPMPVDLLATLLE